MLGSRVIGLTLGASLCASSSYAQTHLWEEAVFEVLPKAIEVSDSIRTAREGETLFIQPTTFEGAARLDSAWTSGKLPQTPWMEASIPGGALLYRVKLQQKKGWSTYCTLEMVQSRPESQVARICFSDSNNDGAFETAWHMNVPMEFSSSTRPFESRPRLRMSGGSIDGPYAPIIEPLRYQLVPESQIESPKIAIELSSLNWTVAWFSAVGLQSNGHAILQSIEDESASRPKTIEIAGSQIEVISLEQEELTFRIVRPFPSDRPLPVMTVLPPSPPIPPAPKAH